MVCLAFARRRRALDAEVKGRGSGSGKKALRTLAGLLSCLSIVVCIPRDAAAEGDIARGVGSWSTEGLGNHRARIFVPRKAPLAWASISWRRRDERPEARDLILIDAATGKRVANVLRGNTQRELGEILFQPPSAPGEYFAYYMPFKTEGWWAFPSTVYLPPAETADAAWAAACRPLLDACRAGLPPGVAGAAVLEIQAAREFHRFDPMEVIAMKAEVESLLARHPGAAYLLFPEDRRHPIRMAGDLPLRWMDPGPRASFEGEACRGEFYAFQIGLLAVDRDVEEVAVDMADLKSESGKILPASALSCINLGGTDWLGRTFRKAVRVPQGKVQALWLGAAVPAEAAPGTYKGTLTVRAANAPSAPLELSITVLDKLLKDAGDGEIWRHSRLRWLDSTVGIDDDVYKPYTPVTVEGLALGILGRRVRVGDSGLLESAQSTFDRSVGDSAGGPAREILAAPMRFVVERSGKAIAFSFEKPRITSRAPGAVAWEARGVADSVEVTCKAKLECDGYINFKLAVVSKAAGEFSDLRLEVPLRSEVARYLMGMGRKGGLRPAEWKWSWDPNRANCHLWVGDVNAGLGIKLKHVEDRWDLYNLAASGVYRDWGNGGKGGATIADAGPRTVLLRATSGPRSVAAGEELHFNFGLIVTPVKSLDAGHWGWRYFHQGSGAPVGEVAGAGATIINLHQGDMLNPYINYPFLSTDALSRYCREAREKGMKVKIYYTVRELSNHTVEFWALRSLGSEVYADGPGFKLADHFLAQPGQARPQTGSSWLCEHAVTGYVPAWHTPLPDGECDSAIATTGLSRWHNYYLEGLAWLIKNVGIDGLYLDGIGYDREIMKRVRKVMDRTRPGCLIDFHSGNNFHPEYGLSNCAGQYLEHFPCIDSLWFGEGFDYNEPPDYWLVEISGIPFGLFGEMLQGGGNPWRGMLYGMTNRLGWGGDPRPLWKLWDEFGIQGAKMVGYWDESCPLKTGRSDVLATAYVRKERTLVALASWASALVECKLDVDLAALGLDPARAHLHAPPIRGYQTEALFKPGETIPVPPARGYLLWLDEEPRRLRSAEDFTAGRRALFSEAFAAGEPGAPWEAHLSSKPGTSIKVAGGDLIVEAAANACAFLERPLPPGSALVSCRVEQRTDRGASWGPGVALVWPDGRALRLNVRTEGRFGADGAGRQLLEGVALPGTWYDLLILLEAEEAILMVSQEGKLLQEIGRLPRKDFPGDPAKLRLGKMSPGSLNEDFGEPGPAGACAFKDLKVLGAQGE